MLDFGWKRRAEILRTTLLSAGHQMAKELPPTLTRVLEIYRRAAETGDASGIQEEMAAVTAEPIPEAAKPLWEPAEIYGWTIQAGFYRFEDRLWWLVRAERRNQRSPSAKDTAILMKVLQHLGADPKLDTIIGPNSSPPGHEPMPFGWWTWRNVAPLLDIQVNKHKKGASVVRIVRQGAPETDGYVRVDLKKEPPP